MLAKSRANNLSTDSKFPVLLYTVYTAMYAAYANTVSRLAVHDSTNNVHCLYMKKLFVHDEKVWTASIRVSTEHWGKVLEQYGSIQHDKPKRLHLLGRFGLLPNLISSVLGPRMFPLLLPPVHVLMFYRIPADSASNPYS